MLDKYPTYADFYVSRYFFINFNLENHFCLIKLKSLEGLKVEWLIKFSEDLRTVSKADERQQRNEKLISL